MSSVKGYVSTSQLAFYVHAIEHCLSLKHIILRLKTITVFLTQTSKEREEASYGRTDYYFANGEFS